MVRKRVYVESSVISYLTARPSNDIVKLAKQKQTWDWWEERSRWELFVSPAVVAEIGRGDRDASKRRLRAVDGLPILPITEAMERLAEQLISARLIPETEHNDAMHIAIAAGHGMDYLVTWNQAHIFNPVCLEKVYSILRKAGCASTFLVRPDFLLENDNEAQ